MDDKQIGKDALLYGWRSFTPKCIQRLNRPVAFLVVMSCTSVLQSMTSTGLVGVVVSSLEKRFGFSSVQSSWIASAYDAATVVVVIFVSHLGARAHRPKWTAIGLFVMAAGSLVFIIPHIAAGQYSVDSGFKGDSLCRNKTGDDMCGGETGGSGGWLAIFIFGRVLHGLGAAPFTTIALTFMDDTVSKETYSLYIGIFLAASVLGSAIGYVVGGYLLSALYTDFVTVDPASIGLNSSDPRWVGAWWLLFVVSAVLLFILVILMSGYPRDLPGAAEVRAKKRSEAYNACKEDEEYNMTDGLGASFLRHIKQLVTNPTYVFLTLYICCHATLIAGFGTFGPKYMETQFSTSAGFAAMIFGLMVVPAGAGGPVIGGIIIKRFKISCRGIMKMETALTTVMLLTTFVFFATCKQVRFAGVNVGYNSSMPISVQEGNITDTCNVGCACKDVPYEPTCSIDNVRYFSPCHGACGGMKRMEKTHYFNCSCISTNVSRMYQPHLTTEPCINPGCSIMPVFIAVFFIALFVTFATEGVQASSIIRAVPGPQRALALALGGIVGRILGTVPAPILFGKIFDLTCLKWSERCGKTGACIFYDNEKLALYMFILCMVVLILALIFIILALKLYKPPKTTDTVNESDAQIATVSMTEIKTEERQTGNGFPGYMPYKREDWQDAYISSKNPPLSSVEKVTFSNSEPDKGKENLGYE